MMAFWGLFKREMYHLFQTPVGYLITAVYSLIAGLMFLATIISSTQPDALADLTWNLAIILMILAPVITMPMLASERASGMDEWLFTTPIRISQVILAKYLAASIAITLLILTAAPYWILVSVLGNPNLGFILGAYSGLLLAGLLFTALGLCTSSLTRHPIFAAIAGFGSALILWILSTVGTDVETLFSFALQHISIQTHFGAFTRGLITLADISYFLLFILVTLTVTWVSLMLRYRCSGLETPWKTITCISIGKGLALTAILVYLALLRMDFQWDLTQKKHFTLSNGTSEILKQVKSDITVTAFFKKGAYEDDTLSAVMRKFTQLQPRIHFQVLDPERQRARFQAYHLAIETDYGTIVCEMNGHRKDVPFDALFGQDNGVLQSFSGEQAIASAIQSLLSPNQNPIYFLTGHGEKSITADSQNGIKTLARLLRQNNCSVRTLHIPKTGKIPSDCAVLVIAGPKAKIDPKEIAALQSWLTKTGGTVVLMVETGNRNGLEPWLKNWGISLPPLIVIDATSAYFNDPTAIQPELCSHPITNPLMQSQINVVLPAAQPILVTPKNHIRVTPLLKSSRESWGETDIQTKTCKKDKDEKQGPFILGAILEQAATPSKTSLASAQSEREIIQKSTQRLFIFGDADFVCNANLSLQGNRDLILNTVLQAAGDSSRVLQSIGNKTEPIVMTTSRVHAIVIMTFALPIIMLLTALAIALQRRRMP